MTERIPKGVLVGGAVLAPLFLACFAYLRPWYFTSETYLGGLLLIEFLFAATWAYRRVFFPLVVLAFLCAGSNLPVGSFWPTLRWVFLLVGALAGAVIMLKDRHHLLGLLHVLAAFAVLAAVVSAAVSPYPTMALLKAVSLLLLFIYAGTGVRLAVFGRENRFFSGLLVGCEIFFGAIAVFDILLGMESMGNPNSLGAVTGVVGAPMLLWGVLVAENTHIRTRRAVLYAACMYLVLHSHARAGIAAAFVSCGLLCLVLRKYRMLVQGLAVILVLAAAAAIVQPEAFSNSISSVSSSIVYKSQDREKSLFASREAPWQTAIDNIRSHFWFGTGFGTTDTGRDASEHLDQFSSVGVSTENGSSYLAIMTWVGMLGVMPFLFLLLALLGKVVRTLAWMWNTGSASHPAVPLAMVMVAGLLHAGFEDWMFAPGYYLCVFFWSLAFVLVDVAPAVSLPRVAFAWRHRPMPQGLGSVAPSR